MSKTKKLSFKKTTMKSITTLTTEQFSIFTTTQANLLFTYTNAVIYNSTNTSRNFFHMFRAVRKRRKHENGNISCARSGLCIQLVCVQYTFIYTFKYPNFLSFSTTQLNELISSLKWYVKFYAEIYTYTF